MDWKTMADGQEKRHAYYASREWALLKNAVRERCGGVCEVCKNNPMQATHHLTYIRLYKEELTDLQSICEDCHSVKSGFSKKGSSAHAVWCSQSGGIRYKTNIPFGDAYDCLPTAYEYFGNATDMRALEEEFLSGFEGVINERDVHKIRCLYLVDPEMSEFLTAAFICVLKTQKRDEREGVLCIISPVEIAGFGEPL